MTPFATAFVPRSSVQKLRQRILSSVQEPRRCTVSDCLHHCLGRARALSAHPSIIARASSVHPSDCLRHCLRHAINGTRVSSAHPPHCLCHCLCLATIDVRVPSAHPLPCLCHCLCLATISVRVSSAHPLHCLCPCLHFMIVSTRALFAHHSHSRGLATISYPLKAVTLSLLTLGTPTPCI